MQKKLIALAITAAFSAPAFADTTVYGKLDAGYGNITKEVTTPGVTITKVKTGQSAFGFGQSTSSRFGVKNTQDLGDGMKATVTVETSLSSNPQSSSGYNSSGAFTSTSGFNPTPTTLGNRELNVVLALGQGTEIKIGHGTTPVYKYTYDYDAALSGNLVGNLVSNDPGTGSNRQNFGGVAHQFGPVKASIDLMQHTLTTDGKPDTKDGNGYTLAAQYVEGPISAGFAYQSLESTTVSGITPFPTTADVKTKIALLGASYDLEMAKVFAEYANVKTDDSVVADATGEGKRNYGNVGVNVPFGAVMGFAQVSFGSRTEVTTAGTAAVSRNMSGYTLGAKYSMDKSTYGYASVGQTKMDAGTGTLGTDIGVKINQYALGLTRVF